MTLIGTKHNDSPHCTIKWIIAAGIVNLHVYCDEEIWDRDLKESVCDG